LRKIHRDWRRKFAAGGFMEAGCRSCPINQRGLDYLRSGSRTEPARFARGVRGKPGNARTGL